MVDGKGVLRSDAMVNLGRQITNGQTGFCDDGLRLRFVFRVVKHEFKTLLYNMVEQGMDSGPNLQGILWHVVEIPNALKRPAHLPLILDAGHFELEQCRRRKMEYQTT